MELSNDTDTSVIIVWECSTDYSHGVTHVFRGCDENLAIALKESQVRERDSHFKDLAAPHPYHLDEFESLVVQGDLIWSRRRPFYDMFNFDDIYRFKLPFTAQKFSGTVSNAHRLCS
jgi:hypothetical protein